MGAPPPIASQPGPVQTRTAPLLVASLVGETAPDALTVAYRPDSRLLVISPGRITAPVDPARQLWLISQGKQPVSLGLVASKGAQRRVVPVDLPALFASGATVALSDEPAGGSPTGQPTGAVLAAGRTRRRLIDRTGAFTRRNFCLEAGICLALALSAKRRFMSAAGASPYFISFAWRGSWIKAVHSSWTISSADTGSSRQFR